MNDKFDEMTRGLAQSVTRRQALPRFGVGLAGGVLGFFGFPSKAAVQSTGYACCRYCSLASPVAICEPPGSHCKSTIQFYGRGHISKCHLVSATPVQDCT